VRAACGEDEPLLESRVGNGAGIPEALLLRGAAAFALGRRHFGAHAKSHNAMLMQVKAAQLFHLLARQLYIPGTIKISQQQD
jgi:hypothetical protein